MGIGLQIIFKENIKILIKTSTASIYSQTKMNNQLMIKHQKPTPRLRTRSELKFLKT